MALLERVPSFDRSDASQARLRFARACIALCRSAGASLGWDFDVEARSERAADAIAEGHAAFWFALELALIQASPRLRRHLPAEAVAYDALLEELDTLTSFLLLRDRDFDPQRAYDELRAAREAGWLHVHPHDVLEPPAPQPQPTALAAELAAASQDVGLTLGSRFREPALFVVVRLVLQTLLQISLTSAGLMRPTGAAADRALLRPVLEALFAEFHARSAPHVPATVSGMRPRGPQPGEEVEPTATSPAQQEPVHLFPTAPDGTTQRSADDVRFTVYRPRQLRAGQWDKLLAFAHLAELRPDSEQRADPIETVRSQAEILLGGERANYAELSEDAGQPIPFEGQLTFVPTVPGLEFDPPRCSFRWVHDVHRVDFAVRAGAELSGRTARGQMDVLCGSLMVAQITLAIRVAETAATMPEIGFEAGPSASPYRKIFASYSHADSAIVEQCRAYAAAIGDRYLLDVTELRAGERWSEALERMIRDADVFQLFWSSSSMRSPFVRKEWEFALRLSRPNFLRPAFWERPLPREDGMPPTELAALHFQDISLLAARSTPAARDVPSPRAFEPEPPPPPGSLSPAAPQRAAPSAPSFDLDHEESRSRHQAPSAPGSRRPMLRTRRSGRARRRKAWWLAALSSAIGAFALILVAHRSPSPGVSAPTGEPVTGAAPDPIAPVTPSSPPSEPRHPVGAPHAPRPVPAGVLITSTPNADVYLDGVKLGTTPLRVHARSGVLELRRTGYKTQLMLAKSLRRDFSAVLAREPKPDPAERGSPRP